MASYLFCVFVMTLAALPALVFASNFRLYRRVERGSASKPCRVSLLIPARNEESSIADAVRAGLASRGVDLEIIVLDDHSTDRTASIVAEFAKADPRVRLESSVELPPGWCGKQHACWQLARLAKHDVIAWIDADVRLEPDGLAKAANFMAESNSDLVSGVPRQVTGTFLEKLLIPLIHFVLLGYLPLWKMRETTQPAFGAGCGQFFMSHQKAYAAAGGHAAIKSSLHDGVKLPRAYRSAGLGTDLFDATDAASCRMYKTAAETWHGLAKNANEGLGSAGGIVPWTVLLLAGQVAPWALIFHWATHPSLPPSKGHMELATGLAAIAAGYAIRIASAVRYRQSWLGVLLHPVGVTLLVAIQWYALMRRLLGRRSTWRGRAY